VIPIGDFAPTELIFFCLSSYKDVTPTEPFFGCLLASARSQDLSVHRSLDSSQVSLGDDSNGCATVRVHSQFDERFSNSLCSSMVEVAEAGPSLRTL
jgi:hypothetical protein